MSLRPAGRYVLQDAEATFATLVAAARDRGECAIGYIGHESRTDAATQGVRLNPPKDERRVWNAEDHLVVLATDPGIAPAPVGQADSTGAAASAAP